MSSVHNVNHDETNNRTSNRRGLLVAVIVAAIGVFSLGALTVLGTPESPQRADAATHAAVTNTAAREAERLAVALDVQPIELPDGLAYALTLGAMAPRDGAAALKFNSGRVFDFVVLQAGREVWRWSDGRAFHQALHERVIDAGTLHTFVELWDGRDAQGQLVVGDVTIRASLQTNPVVATEPVTITIDSGPD